jgi:hypothetical protein
MSSMVHAPPQFPCAECMLDFLDQQSLTRHLASTIHRPLGFGCVECDLKFADGCSLARHKESIIHSNPQFTCSDCRLNFHDFASLEIHSTSIVHAPLRYTCITCDVVVYTKEDFDSHLSSILHMPPLYVCERCDLEFSVALSFEKHITSDAHLLHAAHICEQCDSAFSSEYTLGSHVAKKHQILLDCNFRLPTRPLELLQADDVEQSSDHITSTTHPVDEHLLGDFSEAYKDKSAECGEDQTDNPDMYELMGQGSELPAEEDTFKMLKDQERSSAQGGLQEMTYDEEHTAPCDLCESGIIDQGN